MNSANAIGLILLMALPPAFGQMPPPDVYPGLPGNATGINRGIDIRTDKDEKGYYLIVTSPQLTPAQIKVNSDANSITVEADTSNSREVTQQNPGGNSYYRSFSYSSSQSHFYRRVPLPPDADGFNTVREDGEHQVTVFIPRINQQ